MSEFADKEQQKSHHNAPSQRDTPQPTHHPTANLRRLQSAVGNQALQRMLAEGAINLGGHIVQPKMTVGAADDPYEQEADTVADQIMTMPDPLQRQDMPEEDEELLMKRVQRQDMPEEDEELLMKRVQRQDVAEDIPEVTGDVESQINSMSGNGSKMPDNAREFFEPRFGQDFSNVNIHTGSQSDHLNRQLNARAFTTGSDIFFRDGEYNPESSGGRELMAHELTHVVQQGGSQAMHKADASLQRKVGNTIQRNPAAALGAAEWIALGTAGYAVAQDAVSGTAGDIKYKFDEMSGTLFANGAKDTAEYRKTYPNTRVREIEKTLAVWAGTSSSRKAGLKVAIRFRYDGHSIGDVSMRVLENYDWPLWGANIDFNLTANTMSSGDLSKVRLTINLNKDKTFSSGVDSGVFNLTGGGDIEHATSTDYFHYEI